MKQHAGDERSLFDMLAHSYVPTGLQPDEIIVDSFAGGGGASLGIHWALGRGPHIAINHDKEAIALHAANHPDSEHHPEDVWHVDPVKACRGRKVGLMWLSPDCKHFSKAKGGKPVSKKIRGLAWTAVRWANAVRPRVIILENVEEFQTWGPVLRKTNRPDPARRGHTFRQFVRRLERLGYDVQWRELRACDYGTPTIRKRLFLIARCDGAPIVWPSASHGKGRGRPWRTAAECIDWTLECPSIFSRKKELAENTLKRIARGIRRYVLESPKPFIVEYHSPRKPGDDRVRSVDEPLPTQSAENRFGLITPIIAGVGGRAGQSPERSVTQPFQTITAKGDAALVVPHITVFHTGATGSDMNDPMPTVTANSFIKRPGGCAPLGVVAAHVTPLTHHGENRGQSPAEPLATVTGAHRGEQALVSAFLKPRYTERDGQAPRCRSLDEPASVIVPTGNGGDLVTAFLAKHFTGVVGSELDNPMPTVTTIDHNALVTADLRAAHIKRDFGTSTGAPVDGPLPTITADAGGHASLVASTLIQYNNGAPGQDVDEPMGTIMSRDKFAEVRAFLIAYYGTEQASGDLSRPAPSVTAKDRFGLVTVAGVDYAIADIGMRMLAPRELYRAQGFPDSYRIDIPYTNPDTGKTAPLTKTAQVRMCGNSVCPPLAAAIVRANVGGAGTWPMGAPVDEIACDDADRFEWFEAEDVA